MCYFSFVKIIYEQINFTEKDQMNIIFSICSTVCNRPGDVVTLPFGGGKYKKNFLGNSIYCIISNTEAKYSLSSIFYPRISNEKGDFIGFHNYILILY